MPKFSEIPSFTRTAGYRVNVEWQSIEYILAHYQDKSDGLAVLNLDPDFQRGHVWTEAQQIAFVEYGLKGGTSGKEIYFNCVGWMSSFKGPFELVDGKQRINAVLRFIRNEIPAFDYYFKEYEGRMPPGSEFYFSINNLKTRSAVLKWYLEMNSGGTPHTMEELEKVRIMIVQKELEDIQKLIKNEK